MGFETFTRLLFLASFLACLAYGFIFQDWIMVGAASLLWIIRYIMQMIVFRKTSIALGERKFYTTLLLFDWMQPLWNFRIKLQQRARRKDEFMRK